MCWAGVTQATTLATPPFPWYSLMWWRGWCDPGKYTSYTTIPIVFLDVLGWCDPGNYTSYTTIPMVFLDVVKELVWPRQLHYLHHHSHGIPWCGEGAGMTQATTLATPPFPWYSLMWWRGWCDPGNYTSYTTIPMVFLDVLGWCDPDNYTSYTTIPMVFLDVVKELVWPRQLH